jgi:hypothetical protein
MDQLALVDRAREVAAGEPRVLAAWIAGSLANGVGDDYADIDLHLLVTDECLDEFDRIWIDLIHKIGPMVMVRPIAGITGGYAITPEWKHLDVVCHAAGTFDAGTLRGCWPLFDKVGLLPTEITPGPSAYGEPYFPAEVVDFYFYLLGNLAVVLGRDELVLASNGAVARRDAGLVPLMLAENGVRKYDGNKRLNPYLTVEQRTVLESLPPVAPTRESVIAFDRLVAAEVRRRGRALAAATGNAWPAAFESATYGYLRRELGVDFDV